MVRRKETRGVSCCPNCNSDDLLNFDGDQFCMECNWDSLQMSVERGDLDDAIYNYEESLIREGGAPLGLDTLVPTRSKSKAFDGSAA